MGYPRPRRAAPVRTGTYCVPDGYVGIPTQPAAGTAASVQTDVQSRKHPRSISGYNLCRTGGPAIKIAGYCNAWQTSETGLNGRNSPPPCPLSPYHTNPVKILSVERKAFEWDPTFRTHGFYDSEWCQGWWRVQQRQVKSSQVKSSQVKSSQVKSSQVK